MLAHIDGDFLRYASSGSPGVERRYYTVQGLKDEFRYKKDAVLYCKEHDIPVENIEARQEVIDESLMYTLIDQMMDRIMHDTGATEYLLYIEGEGNYRKDIWPAYKSSRKKYLTPMLKHTAEDYLIDVYGAIPVEDIETDDEVAISYNEYGGVLCSNDKDLRQVPGVIYNPDTRSTEIIKEHEAVRILYEQILCGDSVDDIPGAPKIGKKRAQQHLAGCDTAKEMWDVCLELYDDDDFANLNAQLVYILRSENDKWKPPA